MENKWSPQEGREEEEQGSERGRRGEAHNAMGHGSWTDSICSRLSVAPVMDEELERHRERGKEVDGGAGGRKKARQRDRRGEGRMQSVIFGRHVPKSDAM